MKTLFVILFLFCFNNYCSQKIKSYNLSLYVLEVSNKFPIQNYPIYYKLIVNDNIMKNDSTSSDSAGYVFINFDILPENIADTSNFRCEINLQNKSKRTYKYFQVSLRTVNHNLR